MKYVISGPAGPFKGRVSIPSSKSISNRLLIMQALSEKGGEPARLSGSDDTRVLRHALKHPSEVVDIGHAGTAMRFLTAYFAVGQREVILTGSERMKQRPIGPLVEALRYLGAEISYLGAEGFPPLQISGGLRERASLVVDGGISSQFISALMMIAPVMERGLHIRLTGDIVSSSYIEMTLALMRSGGVKADFNGTEIHIEQGSYQFDSMAVEADWSSASYWFQVAAFLPGSEIELPGLERESLQGDAALVALFDRLGVSTEFTREGIIIRSDREAERTTFSHDFTLCPDLVQTMAATLCGLGIPFHFKGTRTLRVKETDRVAALQAELGKFAFKLGSDRGGDWISYDGSPGNLASQEEVLIQTYHDHRMAMAMAPLAAALDTLAIDDPEVVSKSYPGYWDDLRRAGFGLSH